jgi:deoxyribodipyrimidine photo-lyase
MSEIDVALIEVDAHNIVPARLASNKIEYGANTFRPKLLRLLNEFLVPFPELEPQTKTEHFKIQQIDWKVIHSGLKVDKTIKPVEWLHSGEEAAADMLQYFIGEKLSDYALGRNDPISDKLSNLSPYLHFGQISAQKVALEIKKTGRDEINTTVFLDELIIRRELAENYCFYNKNYDQLDNIPTWASTTLNNHKYDEREFIYSPEEFEKAQTHDDLWNAAQLEMVNTGKMHSYLRMYWAKKILEWSPSPAEAFNIAIYLNDKYQLDGRDPNGYAGCAWAIGGVHDRAWNERPVYGKIRYMNRNGVKRKFNIKNYIGKWYSSEVQGGT